MGGRLEGKVALITAAASGIGRSTARRFVAEGARVVAGDINDDGLHALRAELGDGVHIARCDVTSEADLEALSAAAVERFGGLDIAIANAGSGTFSPIAEHPLDEWQKIIDLCLTGVFLTVKHAVTGAFHLVDGGASTKRYPDLPALLAPLVQ